MSEMNESLLEILKLRIGSNLDSAPNHLGALLRIIELNQFHIFRHEGNLIGYCAWFLVSPEVFDQIRKFGGVPRYHYEYGEGKLMVIFDVVLSYAYRKEAIKQLIKLLREFKVVGYSKRKSFYVWVKQPNGFKKTVYTPINSIYIRRPVSRAAYEKVDAPKSIRARDITVVIPVKDNQIGINTFLDKFLDEVDPTTYPHCIVIVDNLSAQSIYVPNEYPVPLKLVRCDVLGAAAARNMGGKACETEWILFTDSDVIPTSTFIEGYLTTENICVGYAGAVRIEGADPINHFYRNDETLHPEVILVNGAKEPMTIVTVNCLISKVAFDAVCGFDERYIYGGEDTDFGFRIKQLGSIKFAPRSVVIHDFNDGIDGFIRRFIKYGKGDCMLAEDYTSSPFDAKMQKLNHEPVTFSNAIKFLGYLKQVCLEIGFKHQKFRNLIEPKPGD